MAVLTPDITGSTVDITYPSSTPAVFSGDLNDDGVANSGDNPVVKIDNSSGEITLKGIRVTKGYSNSADRSGIHIAAGTDKNITPTCHFYPMKKE